MIKIPGRIPLTIHPVFWFVAIFIAWINTQTLSGTVIFTGIILFSVIIHEFGHALTAIAFGQNAKIELVGFGGATYRQGGRKLRPWQEFIIVLNGPLAGFLLALFAGWLHLLLNISHSDSLLSNITQTTFYVNIFWTILNLAPVQPLDGGKLLTIFLEGIFGLRGKKVSLFISLMFAALLGIVFLSTQNFLIGAFFLLFTFESFRAWKHSLSITKQDQNFILQHELKEAEYDMANGRKDEALKKFSRLKDMAKAGIIYLAATENAAHLLAEKGDVQEAHDLLVTLGKKLSPEGTRLLHRLAYRKGDWNEAIALGNRTYHYHPDSDTALINAMCHAILGQVKPAVGWLHCAIKEGLPNMNAVLTQKEFDPIRNDPLFLELKAGHVNSR
ncbi:MAG: M50 family metallopeptidase [Parachlamydiaceae bacterium]